MIQELSHLIAQYGYLAIAVGCFFEGETAILLGMLAASNGILVNDYVWLSAVIGTLLGDNIWFHFGRFVGRPTLARRPTWHARATRVEAIIERYGSVVMVGFRFLYAMRSITPFALGSIGVSSLRFLFYDFIGTLIWASTVTVVAYYLADAIAQVLTHIQNVEQALLAAIIAIMVTSFGIYCYRHRNRSSDRN